MQRGNNSQSTVGIQNSPFVWFGGKRKVANLVWDRLGDVNHYIEPFFGSGAVLLRRPTSHKLETVNDADGLLANFWRSIKVNPELVAVHSANPVNECDLHARHLWLVGKKENITLRLMADPDWHNAKAAGWWVWGVNCWIGGGFCSGEGPWINYGGEFVKRGNAGQGVNRQLPHLGDAGQGVNRKEFLTDWFADISTRLENVRVACGDWSRVCGSSVRRASGGICGVFLDPPYDPSMRTSVYAEESGCSKDVNKWCVDNGDNKNLRIVLAGYDGEHNNLENIGWTRIDWAANGGYGGGRGGRGEQNAKKERLWASPHCLDAKAPLIEDMFNGK